MRGLSYALNTRTSAGYGWIGGVLVKHDVVCAVCCVLCVVCCLCSLFSVLCSLFSVQPSSIRLKLFEIQIKYFLRYDFSSGVIITKPNYYVQQPEIDNRDNFMISYLL